MGQMSQVVADAVPEEMKRVAVELDLRAGDQTMDFPAEPITLEADGNTVTRTARSSPTSRSRPGARSTGS